MRLSSVHEGRKIKIIELRNIGKTLEEIAKYFGVSRERIRQLEILYGLPKRGFAKYRDLPREERLCAYLECKKSFYVLPKLPKKYCSFVCVKNANPPKTNCKCGNKLQVGYKSLCRMCSTIRMKKYRDTVSGRISIGKTRKRQDKKFPQKVSARYVLNLTLKKGGITKSMCWCGENKVDAHHNDYSKPLEVTWLCRLHHIRLHKNMKINI